MITITINDAIMVIKPADLFVFLAVDIVSLAFSSVVCGGNLGGVEDKELVVVVVDEVEYGIIVVVDANV